MKKYFLFVLSLFVLGVLTLTGYEVKALNYSPGVEVGDVLIWETQEDLHIAHTEPNIWYTKHVIIAINDVNENTTWVQANTFYSEDNIDYEPTGENITCGVLEDYILQHSVYEIWINKYYYIVPGTKIGDYSEIIQDAHVGDEYNVYILQFGYGLNLQYHDDEEILFQQSIYTKQGILERLKINYYDTTVTSLLLSINGTKYRYQIPGYHLILFLGIILVAITGLVICVHYFRKENLAS
ncbi:MAG: hypothetical protein JW776_11945 [Candidatus Lokiarchaeota archaeon]|nr:hypothetical protein [Candidatus Lokiarchaeota archaeon]